MNDVLAILGYALVVGGCLLYSVPVGLIVAGGLLLVGAVFGVVYDTRTHTRKT